METIKKIKIHITEISEERIRQLIWRNTMGKPPNSEERNGHTDSRRTKTLTMIKSKRPTLKHIKLKLLKERDNLENSKGKVTHHIQAGFHNIRNRFLSRKPVRRKGEGWYTKNAVVKDCHPRILCPKNYSSEMKEKWKNFPDEQKLKEFLTTRPSTQEMLNGAFQGKKKRC